MILSLDINGTHITISGENLSVTITEKLLSFEERNNAAVKAELERSLRLNPEKESPRKAAEAVSERTAGDGGAISAVKAQGRLENAAGVEPSPSNQSEAKTSDDNGEISGTEAALMAGEVSRPDAGRSASATSEIMDVTVGGDERGTVVNLPEMATECAAPIGKAAVDESNSGAPAASLSSTSFLTRLPKTARDYRPHCRRPEMCGSQYIDRHCHACEVAMKEAEAA